MALRTKGAITEQNGFSSFELSCFKSGVNYMASGMGEKKKQVNEYFPTLRGQIRLIKFWKYTSEEKNIF